MTKPCSDFISGIYKIEEDERFIRWSKFEPVTPITAIADDKAFLPARIVRPPNGIADK
jgi:hypothetical protein